MRCGYNQMVILCTDNKDRYHKDHLGICLSACGIRSYFLSELSGIRINRHRKMRV